MTASFEYERRKFIRLPIAVPVRYKFLSREVRSKEMDTVYEGVSQNLGAGGLLLRGKLPDPSWLATLLTRKMYVGVNLLLPSSARPIKALSRVIWASAVEENQGHVVMGLEFQEITQEDRDLITQYIIRAQMPG
ncbi:MAG: PilZ domain-containing protein [Planctomycetota bacterium]|jgi:c-di-GMP-binding flagellar brake protein YcgR